MDSNIQRPTLTLPSKPLFSGWLCVSVLGCEWEIYTETQLGVFTCMTPGCFPQLLMAWPWRHHGNESKLQEVSQKNLLDDRDVAVVHQPTVE